MDPAHHILGQRLNFWVAWLLCIAGFAWFVAIQRGRKLRLRPPGRKARRGAGTVGLVWLVTWAAGCGGSSLQRRAYVPTRVAIASADTRSWSGLKPLRSPDGPESAISVTT